jgi:hypothetical protein
MQRKAFTLIEVLMAFGTGAMLIAVIYFFHFGLMKTGSMAADRIDMTRTAELVIDTIAQDLQMAYELTELKPDNLVMKCLPAEPVLSGQSFAPRDLQLNRVEYAVVKGKYNNRWSVVRKRLAEEAGHVLAEASEIDKDLFMGYVLDLPQDKKDQFPKYHLYDSVGNPVAELKRVSLVRINLRIKEQRSAIHMVAKTFLPVAYNNTVQADWNIQTPKADD